MTATISRDDGHGVPPQEGNRLRQRPLLLDPRRPHRRGRPRHCLPRLLLALLSINREAFARKSGRRRMATRFLGRVPIRQRRSPSGPAEDKENRRDGTNDDVVGEDTLLAMLEESKTPDKAVRLFDCQRVYKSVETQSSLRCSSDTQRSGNQ